MPKRAPRQTTKPGARLLDYASTDEAIIKIEPHYYKERYFMTQHNTTQQKSMTTAEALAAIEAGQRLLAHYRKYPRGRSFLSNHCNWCGGKGCIWCDNK